MNVFNGGFLEQEAKNILFLLLLHIFCLRVFGFLVERFAVRDDGLDDLLPLLLLLHHQDVVLG